MIRELCSIIALAGCDRVFLGEERLTFEEVSNLPFGPPVPFERLNTADEEDRGTLTDDLLELVFHREDRLMVSRRPNLEAAFGDPVEITELVGGFVTLRGCLSGDGMQLHFTRQLTSSADYDIYVSTRMTRTAPWSAPVRIDELVMQLPNGYELCGWENPERTSMMIATTFFGDQEIVRVDRTAPGEPFSEIEKLADFNTPALEGAPWANEDASIVVFDRAAGGSSKLYQGTRQGTRYAVRVLDELELTGRVGSPWLSKDGRTIVFTHENDLYMATR